VSALLFALVVVFPNFTWGETAPGVEYIELVCNGESIGWRLAADGELTPTLTDFPNGDYTCVFKAYDTAQAFIESSDPFAFTVFAPSPMPGTLRVVTE
jgi:hypothetical protein